MYVYIYINIYIYIYTVSELKSCVKKKYILSELKSCVKIEVAVLRYSSLILLVVFVDVKQYLKKKSEPSDTVYTHHFAECQPCL